MNIQKHTYKFAKPLVFIALLGLGTTSCKKWVEYSPKDDFRIAATTYLQDENDYRTMTISVYTPLQWLNQVVPIGDIASDNAVAGGESASDVIALQQVDDFTVNPENATLRELWQSAYEGINRANFMTQYRDQNPLGRAVNFNGKDALYGEVSFLRAYYYFTLVRLFGGVPLFADRRLSLDESRQIQRSSKEQVYEQIEKDLLDAIGNLSPVQEQKGRITKYAAQALLGKVYLYQKKYDQAAPVLESIITSNAFSLVSDFASIFLQAGENGPESVFEIQYTNTFPYYNWDAPMRGQGNFAVQQCGIRGLAGTDAMPYAAGWSTNLPAGNLASAYEAGDQRKNATILDIDAYAAANPSYGISYQVAPYKNTGLYSQKYQPRKGQTSGQVELNYLNNFRIIRYSEVLLMAAEAWNKSSSPNDIKAKDYLNLVRRRAFGNNNHDVNAAGASLYDAILSERRLELAMEGDRYFDLVRTGMAASRLESLGFVVGKHEVYPIPLDEVRISNLEQNPNY
ncbi:RagB/SusD family nutrient uptake outer membrane protein [Sphingobacterium sp. 1.A.4]|uniref:RagB/SusD family nutrient uptake outer membrane protein n=1 Tax=Sphingobacterium sp. 1.A.4 TaxID=2044603 RepID=UPI000C0BEFFC|nr:RagB/SusD family nutrient uptake outer membrane protein [Sphingobacterium sp. 1.A.4]